MTQESQILDTQIPVVENIDTSTAAQSAAMVNIPQEQMDKIVKAAKHSAYEKGKNEALRTVQPTSGNGQNVQYAPAQPDISALVAMETQKHIEALKHQYEQAQIDNAGKQAADTFFSKIDSSKEEHPELAEFARSGALAGFPNTVFLSLEFENTPDIIAEFKAHPSKMDRIESLMQRDRSGVLARQEMKNISDSIKLNKNAKQKQSPSQPLSQIKPSNIGVDNGSMSNFTVSDFSKMFRNK